MTLQQAQQLNNRMIGEVAWVYDRFKAIENTYEQVAEGDSVNDVANKMQKFAINFYKEQKSLVLLPECWVLQPIENFDNQEQIDFLISKGEFYYCPEQMTEIMNQVDKTMDSISDFQDLIMASVTPICEINKCKNA